MNSDHIIDVSETTFEYEVLNFSRNTPVVVYFWATWCRPCKILDPILEKLAIEANGSFRLARVDVDANPNLVLRYGVRTIPTIKAFSQEQVVAEFADMQPEQRIREFISKIIPPSPLNLAIEKANSLVETQQFAVAEEIYRDVLEKNAYHPAALLGLVKVSLFKAKPADADQLLSDFPESRLFANAEALKPLVKALIEFEDGTLPEETDLDFYFTNSLRVVLRGNIPAALDGLLGVMKQDRHYKNDAARDVFLGLLELLGESNPMTRKYRSELASTLF